MNIKEALNQPPPENEIVLNGDGSRSLEIGAAELWLDEITDCEWDTQNFQFRIYTDHNGEQIFYCSLEVVVNIVAEGLHFKRSRTLIGAANFKISHLQPNTDVAATGKSLAVKNALTDLGKRGGRFLNEDRGHPDHQQERAVWNGNAKSAAIKQKPDQAMRDLYRIMRMSTFDGAKEKVRDLESIYDFSETEL